MDGEVEKSGQPPVAERRILDVTLYKLASATLHEGLCPKSSVTALALHQEPGGDSFHLTRHKHALRIGETVEGATYLAPSVIDVLVAVHGNRALIEEKDIDALNLLAALRQNGLEPAGPRVASGVEISGGVLVINNPLPVTLRIPGERAARDNPVHVVARGPLTVDFSRGAADSYAGEPMTVRTLDAGATIHVRVDKAWEFTMLGQLDADVKGPGYLEGLIHHDNKVTGFQAEKNGPVILLHPGQSLTVTTETFQRIRKEHPFMPEVHSTYPVHQFTLTGGSDRNKALEDLLQQYRTQEKEKPRKKMDWPPGIQLHIPAPKLPSISLRTNPGRTAG